VTTRSSSGYIGPSLRVHGRLSGEGEIHVDGRFEGDVLMDGELRVGESGVVIAAIEIGELEISGHVRGHVVASEAVTVLEGGRLDGDVRAPKVAIEDGGELHGGVDMDFELPIESEGDPE
jgi:cytoskeletal protein CcmA (bactofilin family)